VIALAHPRYGTNQFSNLPHLPTTFGLTTVALGYCGYTATAAIAATRLHGYCGYSTTTAPRLQRLRSAMDERPLLLDDKTIAELRKTLKPVREPYAFKDKASDLWRAFSVIHLRL